MTDMGVPGYLVASSVIAVMAQRLVRVICNRCKVSYKPSEAELREAGVTPEMLQEGDFSRGKGCGYCQKKGYRGRLGIYELMDVSARVRELIFDARSSTDIREVAIAEGMTTLYQDGLLKATEGITTIEEVFRVAKRTEQDVVAA